MSTTTNIKVTMVANVIIPVGDQDAMLDFYTEKLGLEKRADVPFGNGDRWIEVAPAGAETPIALCPPGPNNESGGRTRGSRCRPTTSMPIARSSRIATSTSTPRSAGWATRFRRSSGCATPRAQPDGRRGPLNRRGGGRSFRPPLLCGI